MTEDKGRGTIRMVDILLLIILGVVTWVVASEGAYSAGLTFVCVLFSGLLAMNFFEPVAVFLQNHIFTSPTWAARCDVIALVGLFAGFVFALRAATEYLAPTFIQVHPLVHELGRWGFGVLTGYVTMAFLLTALHTAPLPREFLGFTPEPARRSGPLGSLAPDFQWLGFTQHVSERVFSQSGGGRIFDGPRFRAGDIEGVWPSFPIRYATRRQMLAAGASAVRQSPSQPRRSSPGGSRKGRSHKPDF